MFDKVSFVKSVFNLEDSLAKELPEVILCGRSNVGKSSFINSFFNRKALAKISSTPGKTRSINYYNVDDTFYIVDLPGYGYAKVSKSESNKWAKLVSSYIIESRNISLAFHFIDSRHKPTQLDIALNDMLIRSNIPYFFLLSKADKLKQSEFPKTIKQLTEVFPEAKVDENTILYSSAKGRGKKDVQIIFRSMFFKKF